MLLGGWTTTRNRSWRRVKIPYGEENCPKYVGTIFARSCSKRVQRDCVRRLTAVRFIHGTQHAPGAPQRPRPLAHYDAPASLQAALANGRPTTAGPLSASPRRPGPDLRTCAATAKRQLAAPPDFGRGLNFTLG